MHAWEVDPINFWTEEEQGFWLAYDQLSGSGMGVHRAKLLFDRLGSMRAVWQATKSELKETNTLSKDQIDNFFALKQAIDPERLLSIVQKAEVQAYPLYHPLYPRLLREIHDPPIVLYMKGRLVPDDLLHSVAVVGTRRPTTYGQRLAKELGRGLAGRGAAVISGMAVGIDSLAHWGAIEGGGKTVAVLATGPDVCYPSSNKPLYQRLIKGEYGAVVSEFFPGTKPEKWRFPARNRVISGLSEGVAVVEAGETSGALITAHIAFDQGRQVFAIPGRIDSPMSKGTNHLIAKLKAQLITNHEDLIEHMGSWTTVIQENRAPTIIELYGREKDVFELISTEPVHFDYLCEKASMTAGELSATLTMLELAGIVERLPGDWYSRQHSSSVV